jgi:transmembrane sensor
MTEEELHIFFYRLARRQHTSQELDRFLVWFDSLPDASSMQVLNKWYAYVDAAVEHNTGDTPVPEFFARRIEARLDRGSGGNASKETGKLRTLRPFFRIAAAILLGLLVTLLWRAQRTRRQPGVSQAITLAPGNNHAVFAAANGKVIHLDSLPDGGSTTTAEGAQITKLSSGLITYHASAKASDTAANLFNTLTAGRGGQFQIILPDSSRAWVNSASTISFPTRFSGKERLVRVTGEAFFQVRPDHRPLVVKTASQTIQVLGTEFDVNAYDDEPVVRTTLVSGSVRLQTSITSGLLRPGEQAIQTPGGQLEIGRANLAQVLAWKEGKFRFDGEPIEPIMRQIARWYDVEIVYEGAHPSNEFYGAIERNSNAEDILASTKLVHFRISGRTITVMAGPAL